MNARIAWLALALGAGQALAQGTPAAAPQGAGATGAQIATSGAGPQAPACASCHGVQGEGVPASGFPRLAGQPARYLARQLDGYASGARNNAIMTPIAKALTADQRSAVAAYYAGLQSPASANATATKGGDAARGQRLAGVGDASLRIQACANCHGPEGRGEPPDYPYLAGQGAGYLAGALKEFRAGQRTTDPTGQMASIARQLRDADVAAVAAYFAGRPPPPPATAWSRTQPGAPQFATAPASPSPAAAGSTGNKPGVDTEQGSPTTGGGQGNAGGANQGTNPAGSGGTTPAPTGTSAKPPR